MVVDTAEIMSRKFPLSKCDSRSLKLSSLRLTLSKFNAKYSKSSVTLNSDSSEETDDSNRPSFSETISPLGLGQTQGTIISNVEANISYNPSDAGLKHASHKSKMGDGVEHSMGENSSLEAASSIDSVKTDSILDLENVHSVSSLIESTILLEKVELNKSPELDKDHLVSSLAESIIPFEKIQLHKSPKQDLKPFQVRQYDFPKMLPDLSTSDSTVSPYKVKSSMENNITPTEFLNLKSVEDLHIIPDQISSVAEKRNKSKELSPFHDSREFETAEDIPDDDGTSNISTTVESKLLQSFSQDCRNTSYLKQSKMISVAVQTSVSSKNSQITWSHPGPRSNLSVKHPIEIPAIKCSRLPRFIRDATDGHFTCSQHKGRIHNIVINSSALEEVITMFFACRSTMYCGI